MNQPLELTQLLSDAEISLLEQHGIIKFLSASGNHRILNRMIALAARFYPFFLTMSYAVTIKKRCESTLPLDLLVDLLVEFFDPYPAGGGKPMLAAYRKMTESCSIVLSNDPQEQKNVRIAVVKYILKEHLTDIEKKARKVRKPFPLAFVYKKTI